MKEETTPSRLQQTEPFQTKSVLLLSLCHLIHDIYTSFLFPLLPLLIKKLSMSLTEAGFLATFMQIPALLNPLIGLLADRISVRWFIILAPSLTAIPMSLIGVAPNYGVLMLLLFAAGISVSLFHVPSPVMIAKLSGSFKGRGMSFYMTGGELARTLGPLTAIGAVSLMGLENFYPIMVLGWAMSLWLYVKFKDVPINSTGLKRISLKGTWSKMRNLLLPLAAILCARGLMHATITTFLPTFIQQETGNLWLGGIALTLVEGAGVLGILASGPLSDTIGRRLVLLISLVGAPLMLLSFIWLTGWLSYIALAATGFTLLSTTPVMLALVQEHCTASPAAANGIYMMVSFIARSAIVVIVGFLGDLIGLKSTYIVSACLGLFGIPFVLMLPKKSEQAGVTG